MRKKYNLWIALAYIAALTVAVITFGVLKAIGLFIVLMLFGWGMNLEAKRDGRQL